MRDRIKHSFLEFFFPITKPMILLLFTVLTASSRKFGKLNVQSLLNTVNRTNAFRVKYL